MNFFVVLSVLLIQLAKCDDGYKLILVETLWRHGDRSPTAQLDAFSLNESDWIFGGGGLGELTTIGMKEQFTLGKKMKSRYIDSGFLHKFYDSRQIYIRSTDKNRTLISAMSNMLGMFSSGGRPGIDYPEVDGWPRGFMPVPIHAPEIVDSDCLVNSMCKCKRTETLLDIAHSGTEFQDFIKSSSYEEVCKNLSLITNKVITWENLWEIDDIILASEINFPNYTKGLDDEFMEKYNKELILTNKFVIGLYNPEMINGINVRVEILKLRAGLLINEIVNRMRAKADCIVDPGNCSGFLDTLKYYSYSSHDYTLISFLSILRLETVVAGEENYGQWPSYSADITFELYLDANSTAFFKMFYLGNPDSEFENITPKISGCEDSEYCDLAVLEQIAKQYLPPKPIQEFCATPPGLELFSPKSQALSKSSKLSNIWDFLPLSALILYVLIC